MSTTGNVGGLQSNQQDQEGSEVVSPLSYAQVGQQLFNRELAQPEIGYLQSLYGQDEWATALVNAVNRRVE